MKIPLVYSQRRHIISGSILLIGLVLLGYRYFFLEVSSPEKTLWIVDTSLSMTVEDIGTSNIGIRMSRLDLAKSLIQEWIKAIPGEHAIMSYAREASVESPFSRDPSSLSDIAANLTPVWLYGGSDLMSAFTLVRLLYVPDGTPLRIIVLTDGGSTSTLDRVDLPDVYDLTFIGIGNPLGDKIPLGYDANGERRYKYYSGNQIIVRYDETALEKVAESYRARLIHFQSVAIFPLDILEQPATDSLKTLILLLASIAILVGYTLHPYAPKR